ncbi:saccharopine dehydrogenase NADP-binding domain-containing protein [Nocardia sp. NPDC058519]|uniref:saccharopine dehydrogenase NADP-binding domain-containing protein n=1 Tax=Nocardia sp. NPDC058519 TaxID=3346535 RepID=UPI00365CD538
MPGYRANEVAVFGATGYTGRQIVRELLGAGRDVVCVGRDRAKLTALTAALGRPVPIEVVELTDRPRLEAICATVTTVVNAAGSFVETCEPIARAAIATRTHYVDISGEQSSIRFAFDNLHEPAVRAGIAVIPSAAFYAALADMLASITAADFDHIDTVDIAYDITGWIPSGAAYTNFLRGIGEPITQFDHGFIDVATPAYGTADFGRPQGIQPTFTYPAPEVLTLPRHLSIDRIRTSMTTSTFKTRVPDRLAPTLTRAIGKGLRSPVAPLVKKVLSATTGSSHDRIDDDPTRFRIAITIRTDSIV